ncbi:MAG: PD-(D/E)XK nuclease family protein, partial [Bacteriovoracaceae bacterium]|nr:PD-(D/E)XK nuclease family protein [Bacteriovoracaceae bacterium]
KSSAGRGTKIHELVSRSIIEGTNVAIDSQYEGIVSWALKVLSPFSKEQLRSEVPLKFPFFGHTINGIPDLIIEGEHPQVWDFKTGARKIETEESYWFQLMAYGYSQYQLGRVDRAYSIELVLAYLDEKEVVSRSFDYSAICKGLFSVWQKTACFSPRTSHCGSCEYRPICHED